MGDDVRSSIPCDSILLPQYGQIRISPFLSMTNYLPLSIVGTKDKSNVKVQGCLRCNKTQYVVF